MDGSPTRRPRDRQSESRPVRGDSPRPLQSVNHQISGLRQPPIEISKQSAGQKVSRQTQPGPDIHSPRRSPRVEKERRQSEEPIEIRPRLASPDRPSGSGADMRKSVIGPADRAY